jgi:hypothetical protein
VWIAKDPETGAPAKIFVHLGKAGSALYAAGDAMSALVRLALRSGASVEDVVRYLAGISQSDRNALVHEASSMADALARSLREEYL